MKVYSMKSLYSEKLKVMDLNADNLAQSNIIDNASSGGPNC